MSFYIETYFLNEESNRSLFIIFSFIFYLIFLLENVVANKQYGGIQIAVVYKCLCYLKLGNAPQLRCEIRIFSFTVGGINSVFISPGADDFNIDMYME